MPLTLNDVRTAINTLSALQGAYQAVDILKGTLAKTNEPKDLGQTVRDAQSQVGRSYEVPSGADRAVVGAFRAAAEATGENRQAILKLLSLVIIRLGTVQGARAVSLLLACCGLDPTLSLVVVQLCILLAGTDTGRQVIQRSEPALREAARLGSNPEQMAAALRTLAAQIGDGSNALLADLQESSDQISRQALAKGGDLLDSWLDSLNPVKKPSDRPST